MPRNNIFLCFAYQQIRWQLPIEPFAPLSCCTDAFALLLLLLAMPFRNSSSIMYWFMCWHSRKKG